MLQARTRRVTTLGQVPKSENSGPHVGPGTYLQLRNPVANPIFAAFGTSEGRKLEQTVKNDKPGPGDYKNVELKRTKFPVSKPFQSKVSKMGPMCVGASIYNESSIVDNPGPGAYVLQGMGNIKKTKKLDWKKSENFKKENNPELHAPSIPRLEQSYGYDDQNGLLQPHMAPKHLYSGLGNDTIGPAYYEPKPIDKMGAPVLASNVNREIFFFDTELPGPAKYDPHKKTVRRVRTRPSSSFASGVPMMHDPILNEMAKRPGPGRYKPRQPSPVLYDGPDSFSSTAIRNTDIQSQDLATPLVAPTNHANPGPADYETNVSSFATKIQQTLTDVDIAFGSSDARYCLSETRTDYDAGPGDTHEDTDKMLGALGDKLERQLKLGSKGVFGTTNARFKPGTKVNGKKIINTPGVGSFSLKKPKFQRVRASSVFKSSSNRMPRVSTNMPPQFVKVGTVSMPGPGEYDLREDAAPKQGVRGFGEVFRFPTKQIFFGNNFTDVPGPDRYRKDHNSIRKATKRQRRSIKPNRSFGSSSTRGGHNSYLKKSQYSANVGPGAYTSNRNSMIKKSFNVAAGHVTRNDMRKTRRRKGLSHKRFVTKPAPSPPASPDSFRLRR